jgi:GNAT superfamily N-acetyltransferase
MALTYFKRYRMEVALSRVWEERPPRMPAGYRLIAWQPGLLELHADAKYRSFRAEVDANVFPCLGSADGCLRLMDEIVHKDGFLPEATWLMVSDDEYGVDPDYCGTIQGIRDSSGLGSIQNVGVAPEHRGQGLGTVMLHAALHGFRRRGLRRAFLEVTAQNAGAIRLYRRIGFRRVRTVYKAVELAYS